MALCRVRDYSIQGGAGALFSKGIEHVNPSHQVPSELVQKWQEIVDLLAEIIHVPSGLVMKVEPPNIRVLVSSESKGNPYERDEVAPLNTGLYCETVMKSRRPLLVPDALVEEEWKSNPDIKLGMISYLGFPIAWPGGQIFGTICVLDKKRNEYSELYRKLLLQCRDVLQADLRWLTELGGELTAQKTHLDELFARVPEAIILLDVDNRVVRVNAEFSRIFGYSFDEAVGRSLFDLVVPDDLRAEAQEHTRRVTQQGETLRVEGVRRRKDGSSFPVVIVGVPVSVPGGQMSQWVVYRDISERKRAEQVLRESEQRFRAIFEGAQIGITIYDKDAHEVNVNPALQNMLDCGAEELSRLETFDELTHPDDRVHDAALYRKLFEKKPEHYQQEKRYLIRDGRVIYADAHFSLLRDATGAPRCALALIQDITERKRLEDQVEFERDRLRLLLDLNNSLVSKLDLRQLFEALSTKLFSIMHCDQAALLLGPEGPKRLVIPEALAKRALNIEGVRLEVVEFGENESKHIAAVHIPRLKALLSADLVYHKAHLYLQERHLESWLERLDELETLAKGRVSTIYPGHGEPSGLELIAQTRAYLHDFAEAVKSGDEKLAQERMLAKYPEYHVKQFLTAFSIPAYFPSGPPS